jgi:hypothetical protein
LAATFENPEDDLLWHLAGDEQINILLPEFGR